MNEENPYRAPDAAALHPGAVQHGTTLIYVLCVLVVIHLFVALASTLIGVIFNSAPALIGGSVAVCFYIAILVGLLKKQEWARINLIWFCYVGLAVYLFQLTMLVWLPLLLIAFEIVTLVLAHSSAVRDVTRNQSMAKTYTYTETDSQEES